MHCRIHKKVLAEEGLGEDHSLEIDEIPVVYEAVQDRAPLLWSEKKPDLTVHVGVSPYDSVTFEQYGRNFGYSKPDILGRFPNMECCVPDGPDCIRSRLDMDLVQLNIKARGISVETCISDDAGRYLCDFLYFLSLSLGQGPVAFVHIPSLDKEYSCMELAKALRLIILAMIDQLVEKATV
ncbi:pyroglutamyl-peptidase 1-like isoform X2 [Corticium candelabrum]|uniref:pyroglutamyl-peptidase 1-like isoform X2 n=1 Tax=Corticium candelabrum TaxID=121492 RepID=UPI002E26A385|nr:pyroglutamyl-peptidase 1-like isoform X2 [Corticium candelabrum]XP_062502424.1 pyroglutamyl-peptidase 1-like isoform X2 [Corticium candelabrum]